jgi:hypothetical protein
MFLKNQKCAWTNTDTRQHRMCFANRMQKYACAYTETETDTHLCGGIRILRVAAHALIQAQAGGPMTLRVSI